MATFFLSSEATPVKLTSNTPNSLALALSISCRCPTRRCFCKRLCHEEHIHRGFPNSAGHGVHDLLLAVVSGAVERRKKSTRHCEHLWAYGARIQGTTHAPVCWSNVPSYTSDTGCAPQATCRHKQSVWIFSRKFAVALWISPAPAQTTTGGEGSKVVMPFFGSGCKVNYPALINQLFSRAPESCIHFHLQSFWSQLGQEVDFCWFRLVSV